MSKVPPSPAQTMTVASCSPRFSRAADTPEATTAAVAKGQWMIGTPRLE